MPTRGILATACASATPCLAAWQPAQIDVDAALRCTRVGRTDAKRTDRGSKAAVAVVDEPGHRACHGQPLQRLVLAKGDGATCDRPAVLPAARRCSDGNTAIAF